LKEAYHQFCQQNQELPIFFQDWYLDAVCKGGEWKVVFVKKSNQIVGVLPYYLKKKGIFKYITMPHLTKMMGPYVIAAYRKEPHFTKICKALIAQLPKVDYYEQQCSYTLSNWLPFYWQGFQQTTRYSYTLDLKNLDQVYANFSADYRNNKIKKAKQLVTIKKDLSLEALYKINQMSFDRQQIAVPYSFKFLQRLDAALEQQQSKSTFFAVDDQANIHSVVYLIWDSERAYYLIAGDDPTKRSSGAGILLVWEAIQFTKKELGLSVFDFQGSMLPSIERVRRQFGAKQSPYFLLQKYNSRSFKWLVGLKEVVSR